VYISSKKIVLDSTGACGGSWFTAICFYFIIFYFLILLFSENRFVGAGPYKSISRGKSRRDPLLEKAGALPTPKSRIFSCEK
jgi:hypothetical protein